LALDFETGKVAGLQIEAFNAKTAQQKVETDLAKQQERPAVAERSLLELQERIKPRRLTDKEAAALVALIRSFPPETIDFGYTAASGDEGFNFAKQLMSLFKEGGWTVHNEDSITNHLEIQVIGVGILVRGSPVIAPAKAPPSGLISETLTMKYLTAAFASLTMEAGFINWHPDEGDIPEVVIGSKPEINP
jgi:hypothetical protein